MFRNRSVSTHQFAMIPRAQVPRSTFRIQHTHKTTFDAGYIVPIYVDEVLPGDSFKLRATLFARLSTPLYPIMDNLYLDTFFFYIPNRLLWSNWKRFMGEQDNPGDSIDYVVPTITSPPGGYAANSIFDYMGLPTTGQVPAGNVVKHNALALRAYALVFNSWFRDENLMVGFPLRTGDGPDAPADYTLAVRGKRHDYFTSCLPWPQKGGTAVTLPLGVSAPIRSNDTAINFHEVGKATPVYGLSFQATSGGFAPIGVTGGTVGTVNSNLLGFGPVGHPQTGLYADLSQATAATINQIRQAFQIQRLLERDARGGTRYTEIVRSHFGVISPDARLQRPEYLGGGSTPININPIAQTTATGVQGSETPLGHLGGMGTVVSQRNGFSQSFTEHGILLGLASVRADLTYQQGIRKMWSRSTRYDFYFPAFAMLGEQAVLNKEIYCIGSLPGQPATQDDAVFGYQERWAEYRYHPSQITGRFRSTDSLTLDAWHLAQRFNSLPTLGQSFITEAPPINRIVAVGDAAQGEQFILDAFFDIVAARPMPLYSVPGLVDHF